MREFDEERATVAEAWLKTVTPSSKFWKGEKPWVHTRW